ncbi:MAG: tetratricopeptide repeat protein [Candidatus Omnitrophica bacterium]|nr:tetratricopeptide repeat protein [Candidatus Omnitrophota bacterium]
MRRRFLGLIFGLVVASCAAVPARAQENAAFQEANHSYRTGDYAKAASLYGDLITKEPRVAAYYYNLGNARVRLGQLSAAILNYEKALLLTPRDQDIRRNLSHARDLLEYRVEDGRNWYLKTVDASLRYITQQEALFAVLIVTLVFLLSGIFCFLRGGGVFWDGWRKALALLLVLTGLVAFGKHVQQDMIRDAIVTQKECEARYGPSEHDQVAFRMGEGIKLFVVDRREDWSRVLLTNGESGWVKEADIAEVKI